MRKLFLVFLVCIFTTSCIPKKDLIYFQGQPNSTKDLDKIVNTPYKLQVNDILDIRIKAADEKLIALFNQSSQASNVASQITPENIYFNSYSIDRLGVIRLPYIGELNVLGYTQKEVREKIEQKFKSFFKDPNYVFVTVKLAGIRFTVLGEVANPGVLVLFQNQVSIIEAIANAGDIAITGNRRKVVIWRKNTDGTKELKFDLTSASTFDSDSFYIQPNDIIYVEPLKQKSWGTGTTGTETFTTLLSVFSLVTTTILLIRSFN